MLLNLITWEKVNGLKAKYVAEQLGLSPATYSRIKNGKQTPTVELAFVFLEKFGDTIPDGNVLKLFEKI
jgi:transcriptional regulator with XRE-family HTH domain